MSSPKREEIKPRVIHNLSVISGFEQAKIREEHRLYEDLGLTKDLRGALAPGFKKIAKKYNSDAKITKAECKELKTVKASIDLVHDRTKTGLK